MIAMRLHLGESYSSPPAKTHLIKFFVVDGKMCCEEVPELHSTHEEADNRMFFHLANVNAPSNVVIRTADTDCLIIGLASQPLYEESIHVWLEVGTLCRNTLRFINLNLLSFLEMISVQHYQLTIPSRDVTASFCRRGKVKPLKLLEKREDMQNMFRRLGSETELSEDIIAKVEEYIALMYGKKKVTTLNEARLEVFLEKYKPSGNESRLGAAHFHLTVLFCFRNLEELV